MTANKPIGASADREDCADKTQFLSITDVPLGQSLIGGFLQILRVDHAIVERDELHRITCSRQFAQRLQINSQHTRDAAFSRKKFRREQQCSVHAVRWNRFCHSDVGETFAATSDAGEDPLAAMVKDGIGCASRTEAGRRFTKSMRTARLQTRDHWRESFPIR